MFAFVYFYFIVCLFTFRHHNVLCLYGYVVCGSGFMRVIFCLKRALPYMAVLFVCGYRMFSFKLLSIIMYFCFVSPFPSVCCHLCVCVSVCVCVCFCMRVVVLSVLFFHGVLFYNCVFCYIYIYIHFHVIILFVVSVVPSCLNRWEP